MEQRARKCRGAQSAARKRSLRGRQLAASAFAGLRLFPLSYCLLLDTMITSTQCLFCLGREIWRPSYSLTRMLCRMGSGLGMIRVGADMRAAGCLPACVSARKGCAGAGCVWSTMSPCHHVMMGPKAMGEHGAWCVVGSVGSEASRSERIRGLVWDGAVRGCGTGCERVSGRACACD